MTFSDTKITSVTELQAPNDRDRSVEINAQAEPILKQEVLASQSAHVDSVSGATYTSQGYTASVQSAIDKR
ncbi:MAG: FMN-binding protein [Microbacteriaceae bacterium]